jgi:hypothetical protein
MAYISKDYETALAAADRAFAICPNSFVVSSRCGWVKLYVGQVDEAVDCFLRRSASVPLIHIRSMHPSEWLLPD